MLPDLNASLPPRKFAIQDKTYIKNKKATHVYYSVLKQTCKVRVFALLVL